MKKYFKNLFERWDKWEDEEVMINLGIPIIVNNYTILLFLIISILIILFLIN